MSESQCTRWLAALGKKVIRRETLPAGVQALADRALLAAGRDWSSREAGRTIAGEIVAVCWEHILHPLEGGPLVESDYAGALAAVLLLVRFLVPIAEGKPPLNRGDTAELLKERAVLAQWLPARAVEPVLRQAQGLVAAPGSYRWFHARQEQGVRRLEAAIARAVAAGGKKDDPTVEVRPALPWPYVERQEELAQLDARLGRASGSGEWVAMYGVLQAGKTVLLASLREWLARGRGLGPAWESIAYTCAGVPPDATPEEVEQGRRRLIDDLAAQLAVPLPAEARTADQRAAALKEALHSRRVLLLVDNAHSPQLLGALRELPLGVSGVLAARSERVAHAITRTGLQLGLRGLSLPEALDLAGEIAPLRDDTWLERAYVDDLNSAVQGHPVALVVLAEAARRLGGWAIVHGAFPEGVCAEQARSTEVGTLRWREAVAAAWQRLGKEQHRRLAVLGRMPFLGAYDGPLGRALWGGTEDDARWAFEALAEAGLVELTWYGHYYLPWLVWLFAQEQGHEPALRDRLREAAAAWRYPLRRTWKDWRLGRLLVPAPGRDWRLFSARWWDNDGAGPLPAWLYRRYVSCQRLPLPGPAEWAALGRMRCLYAGIWLAVLVALILSSLLPVWCTGIALAVGLAAYWLAWENQRRINCWRHTQPSFVETD